MAIPSNITAQRDFSAGEVDADVKRDDERPEFKAGLRQCSNFRILNSKKLSNRPGRRALFKETGRVEEISMSGSTFYLCFGNGTLRVYNSAGSQVFTESGRGWTNTTAKSVRWAVYTQSIYITFPGDQPRVLSFDGVSTWSTANYTETSTSSGQKRTFFHRISAPGLMMQASALTGSITLSAFESDGTTPHAYFVSGMIGTRIRYNGRQVTITSLVSAFVANATVNELLFDAQSGLSAATNLQTLFSVGDVVAGSVSGAKGVVTSVTASNLNIVLTSAIYFTAPSDIIIGPNGRTSFGGGVATVAQPPLNIWDEEVMNSYRGWPASVFVDQNRLGFCNFPSVPSGIGWSAIGITTDLYVGPFPNDAIFELVPNKATVFDVQAGAESNELVFTDNGLWYIPISAASPLIPGSVAFNVVSSDACANVQPRKLQEVIVYINSGLARVMAILPIGAYNRPYATRDISELHSHLIVSPIALAAPSGDATFPERHLYVLNSDGSVAVGKLTSVEGMINIQGMIGWTPWSGVGTVGWVSARLGNVLFTSSYAPNGITAVSLVEVLDAAQYLDAAQLYNTQPTGLPIPGGKGPLWWIAGGTVDLIDNTTRMMGTYTIDANGFLVPQGQGGEDFTSSTLVVGQAWSGTIEPFIPSAQPGQGASLQRMRKRRVPRVNVTVKNSTGFLFQRLKSGKTIPGGPALGTVMGQTRIPAWNVGDVVTNAPPLREQTYSFRPVGRDNDPRVAIAKDTAGPLIIEEIGVEATV